MNKTMAALGPLEAWMSNWWIKSTSDGMNTDGEEGVVLNAFEQRDWFCRWCLTFQPNNKILLNGCWKLFCEQSKSIVTNALIAYLFFTILLLNIYFWVFYQADLYSDLIGQLDRGNQHRFLKCFFCSFQLSHFKTLKPHLQLFIY